MKKITVFLSALLLTLSLSACATENEGDKENMENSQEENNEATQEKKDEKPAEDEDKNKDEDTVETDNISFKEAENQNDMKKLMEELSFTEFEIEISYGKDKEYKAEIDRHSNGDIEAELEDELNGIEIDDDLKAFNEIYPKAKKLNIQKDSEKQDVIDQVLKAFDLDSNYEEFEAKFKFEDGTKISFED